MGKAMSKLTKPIRDFNIEARAHKIISLDKPIPAPRHPANIEEAERILKDHPESMQALLQKDQNLDTRLKDIYVKSYDPDIKVKSSDRPLPLNRETVEQFEFGFHEPVSVPVGRCTLRQALHFLTQHQEDPSTWNSTKIAIENKIPEEKIKNVLEYFRIYKIYFPEKDEKVYIAKPSIPKRTVIKMESINKLLEEEQKK